MALVLFFTVLFYCLVYFAAYSLLTVPLHQAFPIRDEMVEGFVHTVLIALIGTGVCCLLFFLRDKRIVPYAFAAMSVVVLLFFIAALMQPADKREAAYQFICLYMLAPTGVGNLVSWSLYRIFFRKPSKPAGEPGSAQ